MNTLLDYCFPDQAACDRWYYSTDTDQLQKPVLGNWAGESYADVVIVPHLPQRALWWDANHVHFGFVNLGFVSWFQNQDPWIGAADLRAWPDVADLTNAEVIFTIRAYDLYLPGSARIGLWFQGRLPDFPGDAGFTGPARFAWCNYFQQVDLLDDVLGFGGQGLNVPKTVHGVRFTAWRDWRVRLSPDPKMWRAMGSRLSKTGISYQPQNEFVYTAAPVCDILKAPIKANMGIMFAWSPSQPDINVPPAATPCPIFGRIQIKRVRLVVP